MSYIAITSTNKQTKNHGRITHTYLVQLFFLPEFKNIQIKN